MVAETRAARLDLYARTKFTKEGRQITESRADVEDIFTEAAEVVGRTTAASMQAAAAKGLIEMG
jgi:hypothetical protein